MDEVSGGVGRGRFLIVSVLALWLPSGNEEVGFISVVCDLNKGAICFLLIRADWYRLIAAGAGELCLELERPPLDSIVLLASCGVAGVEEVAWRRGEGGTEVFLGCTSPGGIFSSVDA